jgi:hypothetical protein
MVEMRVVMRSRSVRASAMKLIKPTCAVGVAWSCISASAHDLDSAMGLPLPPVGATEVRITTGHALGWPYRLVILRDEGGTVSGEEWMAWRASHSLDPTKWCIDAPAEAHGWRWCHEMHRSTAPRDFGNLYRSLPLADLATLPPQPPSDTAPSDVPGRTCVVKDGWFIEVQVLAPEQSNRITYSNPHACCPWPACQVMLKVRALLAGTALKGE